MKDFTAETRKRRRVLAEFFALSQRIPARTLRLGGKKIISDSLDQIISQYWIKLPSRFARLIERPKTQSDKGRRTIKNPSKM